MKWKIKLLIVLGIALVIWGIMITSQKFEIINKLFIEPFTLNGFKLFLIDSSGINLAYPPNGATTMPSSINFNSTINSSTSYLQNFTLYTNISGNWLPYVIIYPELPTNNGTDIYNDINLSRDKGLAYYKFNNNSAYENNTNFYDYTGNGLNLSCSGTACPITVNDQFINGSLTFDGSNDVLRNISAVAKLNDLNNFTVMFWVKLNTNATTGKIIGKDDLDIQRGWRVDMKSYNSKSAIGFTLVRATSNKKVYVYTNRTALNTWFHMAVVWNSTLGTSTEGLKYYINGTEVSYDEKIAGSGDHLTDAGYPLLIGGDSTGGFFNGSIDNLVILNGSLSQAEIQKYYNLSKRYMANFSINGIPNGHYNWNVLANDNAGASSFAPANYTFKVSPACSNGVCLFNYDYIKNDVTLYETVPNGGGRGVILQANVTGLCSAVSPNSNNINYAYLNLYIKTKTGTPQNNISLYYIRDQTFSESSTVAQVNAYTLYNNTKTVTDANINLSSTTQGTWGNISILTQIKEACNRNELLTLRLDYPPETTIGTVSSVANLYTLVLGDTFEDMSETEASYSFVSRENLTNSSLPPAIYASYTPRLNINHITPLNYTHNASTGLTNFTCRIDSSSDVSSVNFTFDKFYGGWNINNSHMFGEYYNVTSLDVSGYTNKRNFDATILVNISNGFYVWNCNTSNSEGLSNSTNLSQYMAGYGKVIIMPTVHTEPDGAFYNLSKFQQNLYENQSICIDEDPCFNQTAMWAFQSGGTLDIIMNESNRVSFYDSDGHIVTWIWDFRMDESICQSAEGCNAIFDAMTPYLDNISYYGDGRGFHYHNMEWYDYSIFETDSNGVMHYNESGSCPPGGCQPGNYWNEVVTMNGTIYRNESDKQLFEKMLAQFIINNNLYPVSYVSGWLWENNQFTQEAENFIPLSYNAYPEIGDSTDSAAPYQNVYNWEGAPSTAYNPSSSNYLTQGNNTQIIFPCRAGYVYGQLNDSFALANNGTDIIMCYYDHSYTGAVNMLNNIGNYHTCINNDLWRNTTTGWCVNESNSNQTDMATLYPNVTYKYGNETSDIQDFFGMTDKESPAINLSTVGDTAYINSSEALFKAPTLTIKNATSYYLISTTPSGTNQWTVDMSGYNPQTIRAAGIDMSYNANFSEFSLGPTIVYPTRANPVTVTYPKNITVNYTFLENGAEVTTGLTTYAINLTNTTGEYSCDLKGSAIYLGSVWTQNCSVPNLATGYYNLELTANTSTSGLLSDQELNAIIYGSSTCWEYRSTVFPRYRYIPSGCVYPMPVGTIGVT